ncbi:MAG: DNA polymerase/3'-5' exonuclease PolX [Thermodesulfobacteriota bacterium]|nr:MAG: DNA polymerase/3'-5' exonuclease PolX [Thermodesulfobacteriota bacterium]
MSKNAEIAEIFEQMAAMLSILDENPFKIRAYKKAALNILELNEKIEDRVSRDDVTDIPGVGKDLASKVKEYVETGDIKEFDKLQEKVPLEMTELLGILGLGPKTLALLYRELHVRGLEDLEKVLDGEEVLEFKGLGQKKVDEIKRGIPLLKEKRERTHLGKALPLAESIKKEVEEIKGTEGTIIAGSIRRMRETIKDIDILTISDDTEKTVKEFTELPFVKEVLASGSTKGSVITKDGIQVDLRVVGPESYGGALQYFSGSQAHNVKLRSIAQKNGLRINEYGIFKGDDKVAGETEKEMYGTLDLPFIPPELREDRGEIEAAIKGRLPDLIELGDIKGDLHMHTKWSDGKATIEEMAKSAIELGYEYIAITDHSPLSTIANGLSIERLIEKKKELTAINKKMKGINILMGSEVDIKTDGTLDYPDEILKELDVVIASVHSGFKMDRDTITKRILSALQNPYVHALGHPTGRLINEREPYDVDIDQLIETALKYDKALEVNSSYLRLDLKDLHVKKAVEAGVKIIISTDAHRPEGLLQMRFGIGTARRGWVQKKDVLNALEFAELQEWLKSKK